MTQTWTNSGKNWKKQRPRQQRPEAKQNNFVWRRSIYARRPTDSNEKRQRERDAETDRLRQLTEQLQTQIEQIMQAQNNAVSNIGNVQTRENTGTNRRTNENLPNVNIESVVNRSDSRASTNDGSVNAELVRGILNHFQSLQITSVLPSYNGERGNPAEFVEKLEKYLKKKTNCRRKKIMGHGRRVTRSGASMVRVKVESICRLPTF